MDCTDAIVADFSAVGVRGCVHVREVDGEAQVMVGADEPVVLASVVKVLLVTEFARQVAAGQCDPAERVRVRAVDRLGGAGTAGCLDDVDISWRDLAAFAMSLSDNTAADMLLHRIGVDTVRDLAVQLGLTATRIVGGPRQLIESMYADVGAVDAARFAEVFPALGPERLARLAVLDPMRTNASTPRDMTRLLSLIWRDEAGPAAACRRVRELMARQACGHRLAAAFDADVVVAAKSGSVIDVRNEVGVAVCPDGRRYAIAVFTCGGWGMRRPDVDAAIGRVARRAVDFLYSG
ncbi:serine hydrolase [Actinocrispum sp. NPDC049592]|uniref:serine hydrolase n=1 Tax=Actinocrispum sp. NPDC049592 TaxID=3154835 RepID=UPI0034238A4E